MLDITVCILSYNRLGYLREAIASVLLQMDDPRNVIIFDNASDKGVREGVQDFLGIGVVWVGADVNHPFIWNFERAIQGGGERKFTVLMHDDDRLCSDFIENQIRLLDSDANLVAVSCNGYLIDERGNRTGATLAPVRNISGIELYKSSGQVALKYAGNSCIPFSPTVYRTEVARTIRMREPFGKVCDAVYFCDLAEVGVIAYQVAPFYECRVHAGQDSTHFPYDLMNELEMFFWTRSCESEAERLRLHGLLVRQHTARNIRQMIGSIRANNISMLKTLWMDRRFKVVEAVKVVWTWLFRRIFGGP